MSGRWRVRPACPNVLPARNNPALDTPGIYHTRVCMWSPDTRIKGLTVPPAEVTSLLQRFQEAKPADTKPSGQILHMDSILECSASPRLDFTVAVPRGPHFGQFLVAFTAMKILLLLQADK